MTITLITGGAPHYEAGLISGLIGQDVEVEVIGGDDLASFPQLRHPFVRFTNIYGSSPRGSVWRRIKHVGGVYLSLVFHAFKTESRLFHIQWNYKLPLLDRTLLNLFYKLCKKKIVFTAHNIDAAARDGKQSLANRLSLRFQYYVVDHIVVHTERMKSELIAEYDVKESKISVIPHGIMSVVPNTDLDRVRARERLNLGVSIKVILFFGLITPYKGLEYLISALAKLCQMDKNFILVIAGRVKECQEYWNEICLSIERLNLKKNVVIHLGHVPDASVETFFKSADVLVMPYRSIFQSGVLFLGYHFGLPTIATDVGSLREELIPGKTGTVCKVDDPEDMARAIRNYFQSDLYRNLETNGRDQIREYAACRYSWSGIAASTAALYARLLSTS
jgi:D-inositol-3-phosphate glycosyltransferase